jgi:hypothetical protein
MPEPAGCLSVEPDGTYSVPRRSYVNINQPVSALRLILTLCRRAQIKHRSQMRLQLPLLLLPLLQCSAMLCWHGSSGACPVEGLKPSRRPEIGAAPLYGEEGFEYQACPEP